MSKVKGEHFVPQCYLNNFTPNEKLFVYDKVKDCIRENQAVNNIAKQKAFYDFSSNDIDLLRNTYPEINEQYIEKFFSKDIEPALKSLLNTMITIPEALVKYKDSRIQLADELKQHLSVQMAYQFIRTRGLRMALPSFNNSKNLIQKLMILDTGIVADWANFFYNMHWSISVNKSSIPYFTSDNPIAILNTVTGEMGLNAISNANQYLFFYPLSSMINVVGTSLFDVSSDSNIPPSLVTESTTDYEVTFPNAMQLRSAVSQVFFYSPTTDFAILQKLANFELLPNQDQCSSAIDLLLNEQLKSLYSGDYDNDKVDEYKTKSSEILNKLGFK